MEVGVVIDGIIRYVFPHDAIRVLLTGKGSKLANKAKAAFGKEKKDFEKPYNVENQMRLTDTGTRKAERYEDRATVEVLSGPVSPDPKHVDQFHSNEDEDQQAKTQRIRQLAKVSCLHLPTLMIIPR